MRSSSLAIVLALCSLLALLAPAMPAAPADEEIPQLRVDIERDSYAIGDQVNVTIELYANGLLVDPDSPGVVMAILKNWTMGEQPGDIEWVLTQKVSKGTFEANFTISKAHITSFEPTGEGLPMMGRAVGFMAVCDYWGARVMQLGLAWVEKGPGVAVTVSDPSPEPGQTVAITVTTYNSTLVDAQDVMVQLHGYNGTAEDDLGQLTVVRESLGTYKASYTVPIDLNVSTEYRVKAGASFPDYNHSRYLYPMFAQRFVVRFFDVWGQNVSVTSLATELAVWVADDQGAPVEGASVEATFRLSQRGQSPRDIALTEATDATGRAPFSLEGITNGTMDVSGVVRKGGYSQRFHQERIIDFFVPEVSPPDDASDFAMQAYSRDESGPFFQNINRPGETHTQSYRAYNTTGALADKRVNWYIIDKSSLFSTEYTILESGHGVTDAEGDMELTFTVPPDDTTAWIMFEATVWNSEDNQTARMEDTSPLVDTGIFPIDEGMELSVDRLQKAAPVEFRAHALLGRNTYMGYMLMEIERSTGRSSWGPFTTLGPDSMEPALGPMTKVGPDTYGASIVLPEFVPEDQDYGFVFMTVDLDHFRIVINYVILGYGDSTTKGVDVEPVEEPAPVHAGEQGSIKVMIENTGMGDDVYTWTATSEGLDIPTSTGSVAVPLGEKRELVIALRAPAGTHEGTYKVSVKVSSKEPAVNKTVELAFNVMVNGVSLGADRLEATAFRGETARFVVTATNTGEGPDTLTVGLTGTAAAWTTINRTTLADVPEGWSTDFAVVVDVSATADEDDYNLILTVASADGTTSGTIELVVHVQVDGVELSATPTLQDTWRGETIEVDLIVGNTGQGQDTIALSAEAPVGWTVTGMAAVDVAQGGSQFVTVTIAVPLSEVEGDSALLFRAVSQDGVVNATASVVVHVWVNGVTLAPTPSSATAHRSGTVVFTLNVTNTGVGADVFDLTASTPAWATFLTFSSDPVSVAEGASVELQLSVGLTSTVDAGPYSIDVLATSQDGRTSAGARVTVDVVVKGVTVTASQASMKVTQGRKGEFTLTVRNTGNGTDTYSVLLTGPAARWAKPSTTIITVAEGATGTVTVTLAPPKNATVGIAMLNITVVSTYPDFSDTTQLTFEVKKAKETPGMGVAMAVAAVAACSAAAVSARRRTA